MRLVYPPAIPGRSSHSSGVRSSAALAAEGRAGALRLAGLRRCALDVDVCAMVMFHGETMGKI